MRKLCVFLLLFFSVGIASAQVSHSVTLTWSASTSSPAPTYNVYRGLNSGGGYQQIVSGLTTRTYVDTNVTASATYYYVVTAQNANGESVYSNEVKAIIPGPPSAPVLDPPTVK